MKSECLAGESPPPHANINLNTWSPPWCCAAGKRVVTLFGLKSGWDFDDGQLLLFCPKERLGKGFQ